MIEPEVKQMVTVSGRIRAEDGTLLANARINNHIGRTRTDENGEFVMDVDKKYPTIDFSYGGNKTCEVALELSQARGAVWVGMWSAAASRRGRRCSSQEKRMKVNALMALAILALLWPAAALRAAVTKTTWSDAPAREFVFVENNSDDNFFVTPGGALDPRMTGANRWTGLKYTGSGTIYQQSLGYIDNGYNTGLNANWKFDMWLENSPVSHPLTGLRCINWYAGCDMATSLILPQTTDASGFYGATVTSGGAKWMHGMMSDAFYQYLQQMPVGGSFTMTINACQTSVNYDASSGAL